MINTVDDYIALYQPQLTVSGGEQDSQPTSVTETDRVSESSDQSEMSGQAQAPKSESLEAYLAELNLNRAAIDEKRRSGELNLDDAGADALAQRLAEKTLSFSEKRSPTFSLQSLTKFQSGQSPQKFISRFISELQVYDRDTEAHRVQLFPTVMGDDVAWFVDTLLQCSTWQEMQDAFVKNFRQSTATVLMDLGAMRCEQLDVPAYITKFNKVCEALDDKAGVDFSLKETFTAGLPMHIREACLRNSNYEFWKLNEVQTDAKRQARVSVMLNNKKPQQQWQDRQGGRQQGQQSGGQQSGGGQAQQGGRGQQWRGGQRQQQGQQQSRDESAQRVTTAADVWGDPHIFHLSAPVSAGYRLTDRVTDRVTDGGVTDGGGVTDRVTDTGVTDSVVVTELTDGPYSSAVRSDCAHQSFTQDRACCRMLAPTTPCAHQGITTLQDELPAVTCDVYGTSASILDSAHSGVGAPACRGRASARYVVPVQYRSSRARHTVGLLSGGVRSALPYACTPRAVASPREQCESDDGLMGQLGGGTGDPPDMSDFGDDMVRIMMMRSSDSGTARQVQFSEVDSTLLSTEEYCGWVESQVENLIQGCIRLVGLLHAEQDARGVTGRLLQVTLDDGRVIVCQESSSTATERGSDREKGSKPSGSSGGSRQKESLSEVEKLLMKAPSGMSLYERLRRDPAFRKEVQKLLSSFRSVGDVESLTAKDGSEVFVENKKRKSRWDSPVRQPGGSGSGTGTGAPDVDMQDQQQQAARPSGSFVYLNAVQSAGLSDARREQFHEYYGCSLDTVEGATFLQQHERKPFLASIRVELDFTRLTPVRSNSPYLIVVVNGRKVRCLNDTGATHSIISDDLLIACGLQDSMRGTNQTYSSVESSGNRFMAMCDDFSIQFGESIVARDLTIAVVSAATNGTTFLLGNDLLGGKNAPVQVLSDNRERCLMTLVDTRGGAGLVETIPYLKNVESIKYPSRPQTSYVEMPSVPPTFRASDIWG